MIKKLLNLLFPAEKKKSDFSDFFRNASMKKKEKLLKEVVRKASQDQRDIIDRYNRMNTKTAR